MAHPRDLLGRVFFAVHILVVVYSLTAWAFRPGLVVYVFFVPLMVLHWPLNRGACILNNLENLLRNGRWRNPANREEGAWVRCLIVDGTGLDLTPHQIAVISYGVVGLCWLLGVLHLLGVGIFSRF
ncbi:hypothetical protein [Rhizomicrobium palustre]|uniref:hypothetical protein n=1 Tax=Rhizomicrobium palustre TaxID=189966 RepID=UPI00141E84FE|nr:hypothetical protein [Rhizomicrobium palustre]